MRARRVVLAIVVLGALGWTLVEWRRLAALAEDGDEPRAELSRSYGKGGPQALGRALVQLGSPPEEAASVGRAVQRKLGRDWKGPFIVAAGPEGFHHVTAFKGRRRAIVGRESKGVVLEPVAESLLHAEGVVRRSVPESLAAAGVPPELIPDFLDAFRWSVDLVADASEGDRFRAVWTERRAGGKTIGGRLEAARYECAGVGRLAALRWDGEFFDGKGRSVRRPWLKAPVRYRAISSAFGKFRFSPLGRPWRRHKGIDFAAPVGTPIVSVADGRVSFAGRLGEYGNLVKVQHGEGRETFYGHLSRYGPGVRANAPVAQGQVLGYVGITGNATGPHLHFELRKNGETEDFRAAKLPAEPAALASRPIKFRARWKELLGS